MNQNQIIQHIARAFDYVEVVTEAEDSYFFYSPGGDVVQDHRFPFATLVVDDKHDTASNLRRPSVFRLNIGVRKETYRAMFGEPPVFRTDGGFAETGHDFSKLDQIMPHPVYAAMSWVCVLNPGSKTLDQVKALLCEAYDLAVAKQNKSVSSD